MALRDLFTKTLGLRRTVPFVDGNRVKVLIDGGPFFKSFIESIERAEHYAYIESYIVQADRVGWKVADALVERAKAGVEVALLFDGYGSIGLDWSYLEFLDKGGVKLLRYRPLSISKRIWPWSKRNHRKILVADGRVGIVGGMNISDDHADPADGGAGWRDTAVCVEGPAVRELEALFRRLWNRSGGAQLEKSPCDPPEYSGGEQVRFIGNFARPERSFIRRAYLRAILNAEKTIRICNAYFIPDRVFRRALVRAAKRGVNVEIIVAGATDIRTALYATRSLYSKLLKNNIKIFEWTDRVLHAKTAVIDGEWSTIGSSNLEYFSSFRNLEVNAGIFGSRIGGAMDDQFISDRTRSQPIELAAWKRRPLTSRILEWFFGIVRKALPSGR